MFRILLISLLSLVFASQAKAQITDEPKDAKAFIISPADGAVVPQTFVIQFGLNGVGVAPAGVQNAKTGHHHLLIDQEKLPDLTQPIPAVDGKIIHFGGGQTETTVTLSPGKHTLQILLGDFAHIPHKNPVYSQKITVYVK